MGRGEGEVEMVLVEAPPVEADDDPGVWEEVVGAFEGFDVFISGRRGGVRNCQWVE